MVVQPEHTMGTGAPAPPSFIQQILTVSQTVYEQDWLDVEMQNLYWMLESPTAGSTWLQQVFF